MERPLFYSLVATTPAEDQQHRTVFGAICLGIEQNAPITIALPDAEVSISVPDKIALSRIALIPAVMVLVLVDDIDHRFGIAAAVFAVAAATDFFDGYLARRWDVTSTLGAFLDTVADKLLVAGTLLALVEVGRAWAWAAFVILGREIAVMGLRGVAAMDGTTVPPSVWGKIKANLQFAALFFAIVRFDDRLGAMYWDEWLMLAAVVATVASGVEYFARYARVLRPVA